MSESGTLALSILTSLNITVLRRIGVRSYAVVGQPPEFYTRLFPGDDAGPCVTPWRHSDMLDFFLDDAELFFAQDQPGTLSTGIWQEDAIETGRQALIATAVCTAGEHLLVVRLLHDEFTDRSRILQMAREHMLDQRESEAPLPEGCPCPDGLADLRDTNELTNKLQAAITQALSVQEDFSLLLISVDDLDSVKDGYGDEACENLLDILGKLLVRLVRREDLPGTRSKDVLAVLAPRTMQHQAVSMGEKLRNCIANHNFGALPPVTVSIGCATHRRGESAGTLLQRAELALMDARENGKNLVRIR